MRAVQNIPPALSEDFGDDDARWRAVVARDAAADGQFLFAVTTTGVFCHPSCAARRAKRENVRFFESVGEAIAAGFRPCKRCRPMGAGVEAEQARLVAGACRRIEAEEETVPSLADLAAEAGLSAHHFHRVFKKFTGLTPKEYAVAHRGARLREVLPGAASVTEAIYAAGYSSSSRFYERADGELGMEAAQYRAGGKGVAMRYAVARCWLGNALVAGTERGICAVLFADDAGALLPELRGRFPAARISAGGEAFAARVAEVVKAVEHPERSAAHLPLDILGTAFQRRVWMALRAIPAGKTATYSEIAEQIGDAKAVRAVAGACAANHIAVVVPCHRVIRADGGMGGYRWGMERKEKLLGRERNKRR